MIFLLTVLFGGKLSFWVYLLAFLLDMELICAIFDK